MLAYLPAERAAVDVGALSQSPTTVSAVNAAEVVDEPIAVSLADCIAAATALSEQAPLATSDPALAATLRAAGGDVTALPDTEGALASLPMAAAGHTAAPGRPGGCREHTLTGAYWRRGTASG